MSYSYPFMFNILYSNVFANGKKNPSPTTSTHMVLLYTIMSV